MEKELISIIIPTRNEAENIVKLLNSIRLQTYRPIEVLVVDGCSTDGTPGLVKEYSKRYSTDDFKIKLLSECDFGPIRSPANARNIGILNANGKYIAFFDADFDLSIDNTVIEKIVNNLRNHPWVGVKAKPILDTDVEKALILENIIWGAGIYIHKYCAFRKELFDRLFDPCLGFGEDQDLFEYYFINYKKVYPIIIDAYVGRHEPHTFRELINQQLWYWSTFYVFSRKRMNIKSALKYIVHTFYSAIYTILLLLSLIISLILYSWNHSSLLIFIFVLFFTVYRRNMKIYSRIPLHYRRFKIVLIFETIELILKPLLFCIGTLKYMFVVRKRTRKCYYVAFMRGYVWQNE
jgi:glycosyltransferase involved in cell wall biosynthesis